MSKISILKLIKRRALREADYTILPFIAVESNFMQDLSFPARIKRSFKTYFLLLLFCG
jgi:hypothetical protein